MDKFGLIAASMAFLNSMQNVQRRTGRTSSALARANNGDVIVVMSDKEALNVRHMIKERGVDVEVAVFPQNQDFSRLRNLYREGRTVILDHTVAEFMVHDQLRNIAGFIAQLESIPPVQVPKKPPTFYKG